MGWEGDVIAYLAAQSVNTPRNPEYYARKKQCDRRGWPPIHGRHSDEDTHESKDYPRADIAKRTILF